MAERALTIKIVGDAKDMRRAARDVKSSLDETESAGKALARAIDGMSADMQRNFRDAADTTRLLEDALGADMVAALQTTGRNVDDMVREWKQAGITYDEIRADADVLADSLRRSVQAGLDLGTISAPADQAEGKVRALGDAADVTRTRLDDVRSSGDQSRSVLANMVGNSVQDLGALGGVAGTAGMALGQIAEYAADGNIKLSGLAKIAGPMIGVGVAVAGVSWAIGKLGEESERAKEAAEGMLAVHKDLRDGNYEAAATSLQEEWKGTISVLEDMGFTTEQVIGHLTGQRDITADLEAKIRSKRDAMSDDLVAQEKYDQQVRALKDNIDLATTAFAESGTELDETTTQTNAIEAAFRTLNGTAADVAGAFGDVDRSAADFRDEISRAEAATRGMDDAYNDLMGNLDQEEKWQAFNEAVWNFADGAGDADEEMRNWKRSAADLILSLDGMPDEQKTKLLMEVDEGDKATVDAVLFTWQQGINVPVRFKGQGDIGFEKKASGGRLERNKPYIVGDRTDGSLTPWSELFIPDQAGTLLNASATRAALDVGSAGGFVDNSTVVHLAVNVPPTVDRGAVGREIAEALLEYQREAGPVFVTTRS